MSTRIATTVAALVLSVGAVISPAMAQSYNSPAGIPAAAAPSGLQHARSYDDITTGSIGKADSGQLSVRLPELSTDDAYVPGATRYYGPRGEPLAY